MRHFMEMLHARWASGNFVCVGLDPDLNKIPKSLTTGSTTEDALYQWGCRIIDSTKQYAGTYKPNRAFWAAHGQAGLNALRRVVKYAHDTAPEIPVILDAKIADIGKTNEAYATEVFVDIGADGVTVHPYLGKEALKPFLKRDHNGIIVLCRTSNPGAGEFQDLPIDLKPENKQWSGLLVNHEDEPQPWKLFHLVALNVQYYWNDNNNCGLVCGATYPEELGEIRKIAHELPMLVPGIGAQSKTGDQDADVNAVVVNGRRASDGRGLIINASSTIGHASSGDDFETAAGEAACVLNGSIQKHLVASSGVAEGNN